MTNKHLMMVLLGVFIASMNALMTNHSGVAQGVWIVSAVGMVIAAICANDDAEKNLKANDAEAPEPPKGVWQEKA